MTEGETSPTDDDGDGHDDQKRRGREFSRREVLRAGWSVPVVFSVSGLAAACGGDDSHTDHADRSELTSTSTATTTAATTRDAGHADTSHSDHADGGHSDTPHTDHSDAPHGDHGVGGHSDHSDAPHIDHVDGGHTDHVDRPHVDDAVHGDTPHGDFPHEDRAHSDLAVGPHSDSAHQDTRITTTTSASLTWIDPMTTRPRVMWTFPTSTPSTSTLRMATTMRAEREQDLHEQVDLAP